MRRPADDAIWSNNQNNCNGALTLREHRIINYESLFHELPKIIFKKHFAVNNLNKISLDLTLLF